MKNIRIWTALLAVGASLSVSAGWRVAGPQDPKPYEKTAVADLQEYLAMRLGGNALTVDGASEVTFHVGDTAFAAEKGLAGKDLKDEEWVVKSFGGDVVINGGGTRGCLYGVSHFIEDELGVRFWSETEEDVPAASSVALPALDRRAKPYFIYRDIYRNMNAAESTSRLAIRRRLNRNGEVFVPAELGGGWKYGSPVHAHSIAIYFAKSKYGETHPEWYALKDGKRQAVGSGYPVMCVTNPEFRREYRRLVRESILKATAEARAKGVAAPTMYDVAMSDTPVTCECEACKAGAERFGVSGLYLDLYNELARSVAKEFPDVFVSTLAYYFTEDLPKGGIVPEKNLIIRLCDTRSNQAASIYEPGNDVFLKLLKDWQPVTENLFVWDYAAIYAKTTKSFPFPSEFYYGDQYSCYAKHGVKGIFLEHEDQTVGDLWEIKYYLETQLMEDPFQDNARLLDRAMREFYGVAAPYVKKVRLLLDRLRKERKAFIGWTPELGEFDFLRPEDIARMQSLYDAAEKAAAGNAKIVRRVRRARLGTDDIGRLVASFERFRWKDGFRFPPEGLDRVGRQFEKDTRIVDDPESPTGRALEVPLACDKVNNGFALPFLIGVRDQSVPKTVYQQFYKEADTPFAAKGYTTLALEDVVFPKDSFIYTTRTWQVQRQTGYPQLTAGGRHWDIRVSVRYADDKLYVGCFDIVPHKSIK